MPYRVLVDENFHYMDESERYEAGEFDTLEAAVAACKRLVDEFLVSTYQPGMTAAELSAQYAFFGEDPFVATADGTVPFSARDYAQQRIREMCHGKARRLPAVETALKRARRIHVTTWSPAGSSGTVAVCFMVKDGCVYFATLRTSLEAAGG